MWKKKKNNILKVCFKILSIFLVNLILIGCFSNSSVKADISNLTQNSSKYFGKVSFYNYYGKYQTADESDNRDNDHYSFEIFNKKISDYAAQNGMEYPLYFGDFNASAGNNSTGTVSNPLQGQPLLGNAYNFYWINNRANRKDNNYTASVQGLVSNELNENGNITQDKVEFIVDLENSDNKEYNYKFDSITVDGGEKEIVNEKEGHSNVLKINLNNKTPNATKSFRVSLPIDSEDFSQVNKYLIFDIYSELDDAGAPFIALRDKNGKQIAGWANGFIADANYDNETSKNEWKTVIVDLEKLKSNVTPNNGVNDPQNFDFSNIVTLWIGHWSQGSMYIDNIKFYENIYRKNKTATVELPYFNKDFVESAGQVIEGLSFPFKKRLKNGAYYYTFSSGKSGYKIDNQNITDVVRINESNNNLDYWFDVSDDDKNTIVRDMDGINGWGTGKNEPGFFPFNIPADSSQVDKLNYGFGAKLEIQFKLTADGTVSNIYGNEVPIEFNFKGDDDVWVYIDNKLVLDMGGAHSQTTGKIDFKSGKAIVDTVVQDSLTSNNLYANVGKSENELELPADSYTSDRRYDVEKIHTLTLFYMERGMIESNLYIDFNFIPSDNELIVEKEVDTSGVNEVLAEKTSEIANNIDFGFNIDENKSLKNNINYILNINNQLIDKTMDGNKFELKNSNTATFYNKFSEESKVVVNEIEDDRFTTSWITKDLSKKGNEKILGEGTGLRINELTIPKSAGIYEKYIYYVKFVNKINTGKLNIAKEIQALQGQKPEDHKNDLFNFKVEFTSILGNEIDSINYNGKYYVSTDGVEGQVEKEAVMIGEDWIIQLKAGETAEIRDIPINTKYKITEILDDKYDLVSINGQIFNENASIEDEITSTTDAHKITYVNKKKLRDLQLIKVDAGDSSIKLSGAEFILNKLKEDGTEDEGFNPIGAATDESGQVTFKDLPYGKYIIKESTAPEGYQLLKEPIIVEIKESDNAVISIEISNIKNIVLPVTGGSGTAKNNYIGFILIVLAAISYIAMVIKIKNYKREFK